MSVDSDRMGAVPFHLAGDGGTRTAVVSSVRCRSELTGLVALAPSVSGGYSSSECADEGDRSYLYIIHLRT